MSDERDFGDYTRADHARVAYCEASWTLVTGAHDQAIPRSATPPLTITSALNLTATTKRLVTLAVVAAHEAGSTWDRIGGALGVSKQTAHERYSGEISRFHREINQVLTAIDAGSSVPDALSALHAASPLGPVAGRPLVVDTGWYAPRLDAWLSSLPQLPGHVAAPHGQGALLAQLSDARDSLGCHAGSGTRGVDAREPRCPFTAEMAMGADVDHGSWYACALPQGHGGRHQLVVSGHG